MSKTSNNMMDGEGYGSGIKVHPNVLLSVIAVLLMGMSGLITYIWLDFKELTTRRFEQQTQTNQDFRDKFNRMRNRQENFEVRLEGHDSKIKKNSNDIEEIKMNDYE